MSETREPYLVLGSEVVPEVEVCVYAGNTVGAEDLAGLTRAEVGRLAETLDFVALLILEDTDRERDKAVTVLATVIAHLREARWSAL